jgi:hypothetical protein
MLIVKRSLRVAVVVVALVAMLVSPRWGITNAAAAPTPEPRACDLPAPAEPIVPAADSGFKVRRNSDSKVGVSTAGHCRTITGWSGNLYSGTNLLGQFYNWLHNGGDWGFISDSTYSNIIYTDPCSPCIRSVTGTVTTFVGESVCASGVQTSARCSLVVQSLLVTLCGGGGCADDIWAKRTALGIVCQQGDSGGPVFVPSGANSASARGHISFASNPPDNNCWYNDIVRMQNAGFTLLTT